MLQKFTIQERVRWSDVDYAGIVFYGSYLRFLEIAEEELFRTALQLSPLELYNNFNIWLPRVQIHCDFRSSAELNDLLEVTVWVSRFGGRSITLHFEVHKLDEARLILEAHTTMACLDRTTRKSRWMPDEIAAKMGPYVAAWGRPQPAA